MLASASPRFMAVLVCVMGAALCACSIAVSFTGLTGGSSDAGATEAGGTDAPFNDGAATSPDAGADADAAPIPMCDPTKPFGTPTLVAGLDTSSDKQWGRLSTDELEIFYQAGGSTGAQVFLATRMSRLDGFGAPSLVSINDPGTTNYDPMLSPDNVTLVFSSGRNGGPGGRDLQRATRTARTADFGPVTAITAVNTGGDESQPYLTLNNAALWLGVDEDIFVAQASGNSFTAPVAVAELNTSSDEEFPVPSADGSYLYFASNRAPATAADVWLARRPSSGAPFGTPVQVSELNSTADDTPTWLSLDGCRIYITSARAGGRAIYVAGRSP
jgi:hypothetical protein